MLAFHGEFPPCFIGEALQVEVDMKGARKRMANKS